MDNWVYRRIKQTARAQGIAWIITIICILLMLYWQRDYFHNFFFGPFPTRLEQIAAIDRLDDFRPNFITLDTSGAVDTGLTEVKKHSYMGIPTGKSETHFYAIPVGERFLIVGSEHELGAQITGELRSTRLGTEGDLQDHIGGKDRDRFYPFYLNSERYRTGGYVTGVALLFVIALFWRAQARIRLHLRQPNLHPAAVRLAAWGDLHDLSRELERTVRNPTLSSKGWKIGENLAIQSTIFRFNAFRLTDLVWTYKQVTRHSVNFIPTGKTYALNMHWHDGDAVIEGKEKVVDRILQYSADAAPWAIVGYSDEMASSFSKRKADICAAVAQRRQAMTVGSGAR